MGKRWLDESSSMYYRPCQNVDTQSIKYELLYIVNVSVLIENIFRIEGDPESCRKCGGKVYNLERISSKTGIWHRQCFNCNGCSATLTSTLVSGFEAPDKELYCKTCFTKRFGEGTKPLTYSDTKAIRASTGEHGCPRCGGAVFEAEKVVAGENVWFHRACFDCQKCHTKLDSMRAVIGVNGDAFCESCYKAAAETERSRHNVAAAHSRSRPASMVMNVDAGSCPRCGDRVYEAEKMTSGGRMYHAACFTCFGCAHRLDYTNCMETGGANSEVYCKTCYAKHFYSGGSNKFGDAISLPPSNASDFGIGGCHKCGKQVFEVDKVVSR